MSVHMLHTAELLKASGPCGVTLPGANALHHPRPSLSFCMAQVLPWQFCDHQKHCTSAAQAHILCSHNSGKIHSLSAALSATLLFQIWLQGSIWWTFYSGPKLPNAVTINTTQIVCNNEKISATTNCCLQQWEDFCNNKLLSATMRRFLQQQTVVCNNKNVSATTKQTLQENYVCNNQNHHLQYLQQQKYLQAYYLSIASNK